MTLINSLRQRAGLTPALGSYNLLGTSLTLREGTMGRTADYDDAWCHAMISRSRCFFDVGSNVGEMTLLSLVLDPSRPVVTVDANPKALILAAENMLLNGFPVLRLVLCFVGEQDDEEVEFFTVGTGQAGSRYRTHAETAAKLNASITVRTRTLDSIARDFSLAPDFVKVDVEGAEAEVLRGARALAREHRPTFLIEMHSQAELTMRENGRQVLAWCGEESYTAYYLSEHIRVHSPDAFSERGRCHLLLLPETTPYPEFLKSIPQGAPITSVPSQ